MDTIADGITNVATMENDQGYGMQINGDAACNTEESIPVFIHVKGAGSTYEVLQITDRTDGGNYLMLLAVENFILDGKEVY